MKPPVGLVAKKKIHLITDNEDYTTAHKQQWIDKFKDIFTSK